MATVHRQGKGVRWHVNSNGQVSPCNATVRNCPYGHYDTEVDAKDKRVRAINVSAESGLIGIYKHKISMKDGKLDSSAGESLNSLRELSDDAKNRYITTGKRMRFPRGSLEIDFGLGNSLKVVREDFPVRDNQGERKVGSRYVMTYWHSPTDYEVSKVELRPDDPDPQYKRVQGQLQNYFNKARDLNTSYRAKGIDYNGGKIDPDVLDASTPDYDAAIKEGYLHTLKIFDQIEILSRGAKNAHRDLGIDLFSKDKPGLLELDVDAKASVFQPYDIVESLKVHSMQDDEVKKIAIHVGDETERGGSWSITRIPEGNWFLSYETGDETHTQEIDMNQVANTRRTVEGLLGPQLNRNERKSTIDLVYSLLTDVEPAIKNYEASVSSKSSNRKRSHEPVEKTSVREKLFGLFS